MNIKQLLNESMTSAAVGGFVGSKGQSIDQKYAGPFFPSIDDLMLLLKKQDVDNIVKQKFSNLYTPTLDILFSDAGFEYEFDESGTAYSVKELVYDESGIDNSNEFNDKFKNQSDNEMKSIDTYMKEVG